MSEKRKIAVLLLILVSCCCGSVGWGQTAGENTGESPAQTAEGADSGTAGEAPAAGRDNTIPFKKTGDSDGPEIGASYIGLLIFIAVLAVVMVYLRKRFGVNLYQGGLGSNRISVVERKRIGPQTHVSLINVDGRPFAVVESAAGVALAPLAPPAADARDVNENYDGKTNRQEHSTET